ncbi:MAG: hypothetical protein J1D77_04995 [Muribaculaceae bacterium]|nr:hypothetical protein [Muribaculaceae bacterium]
MKNSKRLSFGFMVLAAFMAFGLWSLSSCGNSAKNDSEANEKVDEASFAETQPLQSGLYDADWYDIVGKNARKGKFDGRIYFALSPDLSAFNVFENGNRTKIDYTIVLEKPFEKNDSGIYCSVDKKNNPVCLTPDSTYFVKFIHFNDTVTIGFNPKPRHTGTAVEIMEKISDRKKK